MATTMATTVATRQMTTEQGRGRARALAGAALELYGMEDPREVELLRHDFVQVFRVRSASQGEFALRLYGLPADARGSEGRTPSAALRSPGVLRSQLLWLSSLARDAGLPVPEPEPTLEGELVGEVAVGDTPSGAPRRRRSALVRWVPGIPRHEALTEGDAKVAGALLARMHGHAEGYGVPDGSEFPRWDWGWPFGEGAPLWEKGPSFYPEGEMAVFEEVARRVRVRLEELGACRRVFGVIHRDPNTRNLLFSGEGAGVIDFDMCGLGHYLFDLSVFCRSLNTLPGERQERLWGAFLGGYEDARPLPEDVRAHMGRHLLTFAAMQRVAAVNRRLELLGCGASEPGARESQERFLGTAHRWLSRRVRHLAVLPCGLDWVPYAACELLAI